MWSAAPTRTLWPPFWPLCKRGALPDSSETLDVETRRGPDDRTITSQGERWSSLGRPAVNGTSVQLGSRVRVRDAWGDEEYTIVRPGQADVRCGTISVASPVGRALMGHREGEEVVVPTPGGTRRLIILGIDPLATQDVDGR